MPAYAGIHSDYEAWFPACTGMTSSTILIYTVFMIITQLSATPTTAHPILEDISVVIPTLGRPILESCLAWLMAGNALPYQVVVVDQGRNNMAKNWVNRLSEWGVDPIYVPSGQRGRSAGLNRGLERATTRFVAMTDDDCFVTTDWLERMTKRLRAEPEAIVTGMVALAGDPNVAFSTVTAGEFRRFEKPTLKAHPFIGGNAGISLTNIQKIGLFDEHPALQSAEDSDYGYRALRLGISIVYDPTILLYHYHWRDEAQRTQRYYDYARSQGGFYGKHLFNGDPLIKLQTLRDLVRAPIRWGRGWLKQDRDMMARGKADSTQLIAGIRAGLQSQKQNY
jgi:GT2 family glycosyltransferase